MPVVVISAMETLIRLALADTDLNAEVGGQIANRHRFGQDTAVGEWLADTKALVFGAIGGNPHLQIDVSRPSIEARCYGDTPELAEDVYRALITFCRSTVKRAVPVSNGLGLMYYCVRESEPTFALDEEVRPNGGMPVYIVPLRVEVSECQAALQGAPQAGTYACMNAYWQMETTGERNDLTGNGHELQDNNTVGVADGIIDNGADFVLANSEYLTGFGTDPDFQAGGGGDFSFVVWVKFAATGTQNLLFKGVAGTTEYILSLIGTTVGWFVSGPGAAISFVAYPLVIAPDTWYMIYAEWDDTANVPSVNVNDLGLTAGAGTATTVNVTTGDFSIGDRTALAPLGAVVDEVGYWCRLLTPTEQTFMYNAGAARTWPF